MVSAFYLQYIQFTVTLICKLKFHININKDNITLNLFLALPMPLSQLSQ